ncbi:MAG: hypothetical protein IPK16_28295 [Anaerolineales bacterium]|nr:hypothetical protein [Anaerolineales bacterium]
MSTLSTPLIHTKLNRPRVSGDLVVRPRLYAALDRRRPLTVVVAPAGYGKTTLISSWVERSGMPAVWLSLDPNDSNLETFLGYLLAAIERLHPAINQRLAVGAGHGAAMSYAAVAQALADEVDVLEDAFLLVLDDYHVVTEPTIHRFLKDLLQYPPRALNLVLATRIEPPLPLAILRGRDQLTEVRAFDLRFTTDEIQEYLRHVLDQNLDAKTIGILEDTTEGWIAGLHLAALYLRNHEDIAGATARFRGRSRYTIDYLAVEVLARQAPEIQDFLVRTSILQRLNAALCDAVVGQDSTHGSSQVTLDHLENNNLFLITLDDSKRWYRYHQLFQQLLEHRLRAICSIDEIAALYRRASAWCASQNLVDEAVAYALSAGDIGGAVQIVEANRHAAICGEKWQRLEAWLELIPRREINGYPELLLLEAWILHKRERLLEIPARLDLAEAILDEGGRYAPVELRMRSEIEALRSQQYFLVADATRTCTTARRALQYAPDDYAHVRGAAWFFLALGAYIASGIQPALDILVEATRCEPHEWDEAHTRILIARCFSIGSLPICRR